MIATPPLWRIRRTNCVAGLFKVREVAARYHYPLGLPRWRAVRVQRRAEAHQAFDKGSSYDPGLWRPARPGDTPGSVEPDDARPQPVDADDVTTCRDTRRTTP